MSPPSPPLRMLSSSKAFAVENFYDVIGAFAVAFFFGLVCCVAGISCRHRRRGPSVMVPATSSVDNKNDVDVTTAADGRRKRAGRSTADDDVILHALEWLGINQEAVGRFLDNDQSIVIAYSRMPQNDREGLKKNSKGEEEKKARAMGAALDWLQKHNTPPGEVDDTLVALFLATTDVEQG